MPRGHLTETDSGASVGATVGARVGVRLGAASVASGADPLLEDALIGVVEPLARGRAAAR